MRKREGFTLAELVLSVFIFSFIAASLATIVSTTNRHMFQNYRSNTIKTNVLISMKAIQNNLSMATRVDTPAINNSGTVLAFARNVDQNTGCFPVTSAAPASWHYFCQAGTSLYYHTGNITYIAANACGTATPAIWNPLTVVPTCGPGGGGLLLMESVSPSLLFGGALFSRRTTDGITGVDTVRVQLRSLWIAAAPAAVGANFTTTQRDVDTTLDTVIRFNRSQ